MAYEKVAGPLGGERGDMQAAAISTVMANSMRSRGRAHQLEDFLLRWGPKQERPADELLAKALAINAAMGGVDLRGDHSGADDPPRGGHEERAPRRAEGGPGS